MIEKLPRGVVKEIMLERILLVTNFSGIERDVVSCLYESDVILFSISICNLLLGLSFPSCPLPLNIICERCKVDKNNIG